MKKFLILALYSLFFFSKAAEVKSTYPKPSHLLIKTLNNSYERISLLALQMLNLEDSQIQKKSLPAMIKRTQNDSKALVQGWALYNLASFKNKKKYQKLFEKDTQNLSYCAVKTSPRELFEIDPQKAYELCERFQKELNIPASLLEKKLLEIFKGFQWGISKKDLTSTQKLINSLLVSFQEYKGTFPDIKKNTLSVLQEDLTAKQQLQKKYRQVKTELDCIEQTIPQN